MFYSKAATVKDRTINYRFSTKSKTDLALIDLKRTVELHNEWQTHRSTKMKNIDPHFVMVRVRARGPRFDGNLRFGGFTPDYLATHYDVYVVRNTKRIGAWQEARVSTKGVLKTMVTDKIAKVDAYLNGADTSNMPVVTAN